MGGVTNSLAQKYAPKYLRENDKSFLQLTSRATDNGWIEFRQDKDAEAIKPETFFSRFGKNVGLNDGYQMKLVKDETDFRQIRHQHFLLYYKDVRVEGAEYALHSRNGRLELAHGRIVENLAVDVSKAIPEQQALAKTLADQKIQIETAKSTELPKGELLLARLGDEAVSESYTLCYVFEVRPEKLSAKKTDYIEPKLMYVNAATGQIARRVPLIQNCFHAPKSTHISSVPIPNFVEQHQGQPVISVNAPLTASTFVPRWNRYLNGQSSLPFETELAFNPNVNRNEYRLSANSGALLTRRDVNSAGYWASNPDVFNGTTDWGTNAQNATTAHWLTQRVHQFYQTIAFDQNGFNRNGAYPKILVDLSYGNNLVAAGWNGSDQILFGYAPIGPFNPNPNFSRTLVTADVLGHEYTHAVTQFNGGVGSLSNYQGESGAINESISDIFGTAFERYLLPNSWNWDLAEDTYQFRSMSNPTLGFLPVQDPQPQIYQQDPNWQVISQPCDNSNDKCGVHINSGVMNKWFHTLCTGQGPNGQGVQAINFDQATAIVYRAVRYYMQGTSGYRDAAIATARAAADLYFSCSTQERSVRAAWRSVGLEIGNCESFCDFNAVNLTTSNVGCSQPLTLNASCNGDYFTACQNMAYQFTGPNVPYNFAGPSISVTAPSSPGNYQYSVLLYKNGANCSPQTATINVNVTCGQPPLCDFSSGPRYVGTWSNLTVQIRQISGKNVLVTAVVGSSSDKYYPRGDNFWNQVNIDPNAANLQGCLNAGSTDFGGLVIPGGLNPPSGYVQGQEQDGAIFYYLGGNPPPPNICDFSVPRTVGTWNGLTVQIRQYPNNKKVLVTAVNGASNDKHYPRGDNFWDNFTKNADAEQYRTCLNGGTTEWYGLAIPGGVSPNGGYQQGQEQDGSIFFSTNGLRKAAPEGEPTIESVALVTFRPNPVQETVTVRYALTKAATVPVRVLDIQGRVMQTHSLVGVAGQNEQTLDVSSLATGLYAVEVLLNQERIIHKMVKQ